MSKDKLVIFDTTLRDGEQSPGASMTKDEKIRIAKMLEKMRVDVIEAGFAIASPGDFEAIKAVAEVVRDSRICSLSRANRKDIDRAGEALKNAEASRIHTFIATSPVHMQYKLQMEPEQVLAAAVDAVTHARSLTDDVEFSCEDASRTEFEFMCRVVEADCHNDLGLAVANSLSAVMYGARQVECTINGLGERAGNASLEEIVMAVKTRSDIYPVKTGLDISHIVPTSRLVSTITGFPVQPNKAIVGANAFAHEAGIHQDGVLKHRQTYEIMRAQDVGWHTNKLVLGKHSGRAAFKARLEELGISFENGDALVEAFARFKVLADKKHEIFDEDLQALVSGVDETRNHDKFQLLSLEAVSKTGAKPKATLVLSINGHERKVSEEGDGPVDAAFKAVESVAHSGAELKLYSVNAITSGTDSQGEVTVRLEKNGEIVNGLGADTDIVVASVYAYINALNILASGVKKEHPQLEGV